MTQRVALPFFGADPLPWVRPTLATFSTWINQSPPGLSVAAATDGTNGKPLVIQLKQDAADNPCPTALLKNIGAPPWTITVAMAAFTVIRDLPTTDTAASWFYPIILYDGTKAIAFSWYSTGGQVHITHFDDVVPESGNYNSNVGSVKAGFSFPDYFGWFRITNDGGTLTYSISPEGVLFFPVYSEAASYLSTITKVGFGLDHYENAVDHSPTNDMASILWSWVES